MSEITFNSCANNKKKLNESALEASAGPSSKMQKTSSASQSQSSEQIDSSADNDLVS